MIEGFTILVFYGLAAFMFGVYLLLGYRNLLRVVLAVEVLSKGVTLILLASGVYRQSIGVAQSMIVTFIIVETILAAIMLAVIVICHRVNGTLDIRSLSRLKG